MIRFRVTGCWGHRDLIVTSPSPICRIIPNWPVNWKPAHSMLATWSPSMSWLTIPKPVRTEYLWTLNRVKSSLHCLFLYTAESTCADSVSKLTNALFTASREQCARWQVPVSTWVNPNMTEDWEEGIIYLVWHIQCTVSKPFYIHQYFSSCVLCFRCQQMICNVVSVKLTVCFVLQRLMILQLLLCGVWPRRWMKSKWSVPAVFERVHKCFLCLNCFLIVFCRVSLQTGHKAHQQPWSIF